MKKDATTGGFQMLKHSIAAVTACVLLLFAETCHAYTALFCYGDSLSDTGNYASSSAYYSNRWSNGSVWVEYLSSRLGIPFVAGNNHAVAGTTTSVLSLEIAYTGSVSFQNALVTVWSGGNDFLDNLANNVINDAQWSGLISTAVNNITNAVNSLYGKGARNIIVCNLPDLGKVPEVLNGYSPSYQTYVSSKVVLFNTALATSLKSEAQAKTDLHLYSLDIFSHFTALLNSAAALGFTVTNIGALDDTNLVDKSFAGAGANYLFWDRVHPTTKAHSIIAGWAWQTLPVAPLVQLSSARGGENFAVTLRNVVTGGTYTVQTSTNFSSWMDYQPVIALGTNQVVNLATPNTPKTFFRVRY